MSAELLGASITCTPRRRRILLLLAQADGQPWTDNQAGSGWNDHMAEVIYGTAGDIVDQVAAEQYGAIVAHCYALPNPAADELLALLDPDAVRRHNKRVWSSPSARPAAPGSTAPRRAPQQPPVPDFPVTQ